MSDLKRRTWTTTTVVFAAVGIGFAIPVLHAQAEPTDAAVCTQAGNVWVHVELDGDVGGGCATEFATGLEALTSAGFEAQMTDDGFLTTIDGEPSDPGPEDWWAYAHTDVELTGWEFYQVGLTQSAPTAGSIEGWRLMHTYSQDVSSLPETDPQDLLADDEEEEETPAPTSDPEPSTDPASSPEPTSSSPSSPNPSPSDVTTGSKRPLPPRTGD